MKSIRPILARAAALFLVSSVFSNPTLATAGTPTRSLLNLSVRHTAGYTESAALTGSFTVEGSQPKLILIRAAGPTLARFGIQNALTDTMLTIYDGTGAAIASNDDWGSAMNPNDMKQIWNQIGAFAFDDGSKDSALAITLAPGTYTARVTPAGGASPGEALLEIYDADQAPRIPYFSTRCRIDSGAPTGIAGIVVSGTVPQTILVRALGPALASLGVTDAAANPALTLYQNSTPFASNDDWASGDAAAIAAATDAAGLMPLAAGSRDAATLLTLSPGLYTVIVSGVGGTGGTTLIEFAQIDTDRATSVAPALLGHIPDQVSAVDHTLQLHVPPFVGVPNIVSFQWEKEGVAIPGATGPQFAISNAQVSDSGTYRVAMTNSAGTVTSAPITAVVKVVPHPVITTQPISQSVVRGGSATFVVAATGDDLSYQWYKFGAQIAGATTTTLSLSNVTEADSGDYFVIVSSLVASTKSNTAALTVTPPTPAITTFTPATLASGMTVTITGTSFANVTEVLFNGVRAAWFIVDSSTQITAVVPSEPLATTGNITVTTSGGTCTSTGSYAYSPDPIVSSVSTWTGPTKRVVVVNGYNLGFNVAPGTTVKLNGVRAELGGTSATQLTFAVPVGVTDGPIQIDNGYGSITTTQIFHVSATGAAPANDLFANAQTLAGESGQVAGVNAYATVEPGEPAHGNLPGGHSVWFVWTAPRTAPYVFASGFAPQANLGINIDVYTGTSVSALHRVSGGSVSWWVPTYASATVVAATAGTTYAIAIDGYDGYTGDYQLTWQPLAAPSIGGFWPTTGYPGQWVVLWGGSGFVPDMTVTIGGATVPPSRFIASDPSSLFIYQIPYAAVTGPIVITNLAGTCSSADLVVTVPPPPIIASVTASAGAAGDIVQIQGTALSLGDAATIVRFAGSAAAEITWDGGNYLNVKVPLDAATGYVTVETKKGVATSPSVFTVRPTVTDTAPSSIAAGTQGFELVVKGGGFSPNSTVLWNGGARPTTYVSPTELRATIAAVDTPASSELKTALVGVSDSVGGLATAVPFAITVPQIGEVKSVIAAPGPSTTVAILSSTSSASSVTVVLENKDLASQPIALSVATYASAPNVGGGAGAFKTGDSFFFDVQVVDPSTVGTEDRLTCTFYYPASVSGDLEAGLELMYFNGTAWVPALDAAGQVATKNTTDNLDGTLSGGRFSIVLDDQSSPKLHDLVGTVFVLARRDHTPPKIVSLSVTPSVIDSKNHKMVGAVVTANVTDDIDPNPSVRIVSITSNEPVNGTGDGDTAPDWEITGAMTANVRAERSGNGKGRIYTITVEARDASGNTATGTVTVSVPKNGKG